MRVVQVITADDAAEWAALEEHIAVQPAEVQVDADNRTITTVIAGPLIEAPGFGLEFQWERVQAA